MYSKLFTTIAFLFVTLPFTGCSSENTNVSQPAPKETPLAQAVHANQTPKANPADELLYGQWELQSISSNEGKLITDVTVEFTRAGDMINRDRNNIVDQGKFAVDGKRLTVTTKTPDGAETHEIAHITQLSKNVLEITKDDTNVKLTFKKGSE